MRICALLGIVLVAAEIGVIEPDSEHDNFGHTLYKDNRRCHSKPILSLEYKTLEECAQECEGASLCYYFNYYSGEKARTSCELFETCSKIKKARSYSVYMNTDAQPIYDVDFKKLKGNLYCSDDGAALVEDENVNSVSECAHLCEENPTCKTFTVVNEMDGDLGCYTYNQCSEMSYWTGAKTYVLKVHKKEVKKAIKKNLKSYKKELAKTDYKLVEHGAYCAGAFISRGQHRSHQECAVFCEETEGCDFFEVNFYSAAHDHFSCWTYQATECSTRRYIATSSLYKME